MKIPLLGATVCKKNAFPWFKILNNKSFSDTISLKGNSGIELLKQGLERGHGITAIVRSSVKLKQYDDSKNLKVAIIYKYVLLLFFFILKIFFSS